MGDNRVYPTDLEEHYADHANKVTIVEGLWKKFRAMENNGLTSGEAARLNNAIEKMVQTLLTLKGTINTVIEEEKRGNSKHNG